ncbi:uracil-DNA glycosylase-like protein [Sordaria brevicollis]|uniref:Uracil-DNA glycosylase-like protein n=1 Tax=Sordaria brevicollis TaxID=83679 RepID=A0AAE0NW62_SORBR|nr:uracil-DNA glycosylase-like protein [Sordaria brevicollis]
MASPEATTAMPDEERTPPPPTFAGRLKLEDFKFANSNGSASASPSPGGTIRRSARLSSTTRSTTITTSPSSCPRKITTTKTTTTALTTSTTTTSTPTKRKLLTSPSPSRSRSSTPKRPKTYDNIPQSLPDALSQNLILLFIGLNPGISTAITQHAYAHPTNLFWRLLFSSGITPVLCSPIEDRTLPERFQLGLTNIVGRPTRNGGELSKGEMDEGVEVLEEKVRRWRPEGVCVVGKGIWEAIYRVRARKRGVKGDKGGKLPKDWKYGWQDESQNMGVVEGEEGKDGWKGARVFVATSTSGLAATVGRQEKERIWRELGEWVERRRGERKREEEGKQEEKEEGVEGQAGETTSE